MTQRLSNRHILIVDDDEDILSSIDLAMRAEGATTSKAADGSAAVLAVQSSPPDAVVLDMMLPKASGFVVMEKIREQEHVPVVVMVTANLGKRHQQYAQDLGVHAYMNKPVSLQRLVDTLVRLLEERDGGGKDKAGGPAASGASATGRSRATTGR
jgi:DNA-binding response OmpR family regulator